MNSQISTIQGQPSHIISCRFAATFQTRETLELSLSSISRLSLYNWDTLQSENWVYEPDAPLTFTRGGDYASNKINLVEIIMDKTTMTDLGNNYDGVWLPIGWVEPYLSQNKQFYIFDHHP